MFSQACVKNSVQGGGGVHPLGRHQFLGRHTSRADGHCSWRYASYWHAFLFYLKFKVYPEKSQSRSTWEINLSIQTVSYTSREYYRFLISQRSQSVPVRVWKILPKWKSTRLKQLHMNGICAHAEQTTKHVEEGRLLKELTVVQTVLM